MKAKSATRTGSSLALDQLLRGIGLKRFLKEFWQRKPLFIKGAVDVAKLNIPAATLHALAAQSDVESRLVSRTRGKWSLEHGPFAQLPTRRKDWTVLVQGVNLHHRAADALMDDFRVLPHARLDDVMISYAVEGGGVGPHFDNYDVFLVQAKGTRRWQISTQHDLTLMPNFPLKILANFAPEQTFVCEPGDLLYLPPQCAHDGVALDTCMTWSVGFRTPPYDELLREYLNFIADDICIDGRYADPGLRLPDHPAAIPDRMVDTLAQLTDRLRHRDDTRREFLGCYLSEPKATTVFTAPEVSLPAKRFVQAASTQGVRLSPRSQMLHDKRRVYINGESIVATAAEGKVLRALADHRHLSGSQFARAPEVVQELLHDWHDDGWLALGTDLP